MKKVLFFIVAAALVTVATAALAGEDRQCTVSYTTGAAGNTLSPASGTCSWGKGATLLVQCSSDVYFAQKFATGTTRPAAANTDFVMSFSSNKDPYIVYLDADKVELSFLGVSASGDCKVGATTVRRTLK